ncbi:MAG TPA: polysaccharide pyruvyl transferase family protein [Thermoanaerobaculia bacterium]|nr:polysaccharide pyruvyl transferase family protein [Thermoanaerobaculia bacterium]
MAKDIPYRVGISGSYGGLNLGDEAILQSMIAQLRASLPVEITVFTRNPEDTLRRHRVERAVPVREMSRDESRQEIERLDCFVLGGGGILYDSHADAYLREVKLARETRVPVMIYAVSAGPLKEPATRELVRDCLESAAVITVRDRRARHLLEEIGVRVEIVTTADPAVLLEPEPLPPGTLSREGVDKTRRLVGVSVREPGPAAPDIDAAQYQGLLADAADFMVDRFEAEVVFIPMEPKTKDLQFSHAVIAGMRNASHAAVLKGDYTAGQILSVVGNFELAVGMRLHFLIFAASRGVPFVALPYASKVEGFIEKMGMTMPPLEKVSAGQLIADIDRSWDTRDEFRRRIREAFPQLQHDARENNRILVELLRSLTPRAARER